MSNTWLPHARFRAPLIVLLLFGLVIPVGGARPASAGATGEVEPPLWSAEFGEGSRTALDSLGDGASATVWNDRARSSFGSFQGQDAWQVNLPRDESHGTKVRARFQDLGFAPRDGVRLEYDVFIESEAALGRDLKLPGIASAPASQSLWYASSGGDKRADSASVRMHPRPAGHFGVGHPYLDVYAYADSGGGQSFAQWGLYWRLADKLNATGRSTGDEFRIPIGEWFTITLEAEMNSPGANDGALRVWLDGRQGIDLADMQWVRSAPYVWTQTMFETFYSTGAHPGADVRFANMTMSPIDGPATAPAPPPTPAPEPPVAAFTVSSSSPVVGEPVTFDAGGSQRAVAWSWDDAAPGDWPLGAGETMTFTFRNAGTKQVRLTVTDDQGRTDTVTRAVTVAAAAPSATTRWDFDDGRQGWEAGRSGVQVSHDRSVSHSGPGSLRGRTRFGADTTGVVRFRSAGATRDWSAAGGELGTWVHVPANAGGSNWRARIEIQNSSDWAYTTGSLQTLRPGQWTYVSHDFGSATRDVYRVAVQVQAWNVGGDRNVHIDTVRQRP